MRVKFCPFLTSQHEHVFLNNLLATNYSLLFVCLFVYFNKLLKKIWLDYNQYQIAVSEKVQVTDDGCKWYFKNRN